MTMLELHNLSPAPGARKKRKRIGRGPGSGNGKTAGKGHKGQKARAGYSRRLGFEGGQLDAALGREAVRATACNIARKDDLKALVDFANSAFGKIDILVSNAASEWLTRAHRINRFVVIGLIALHLAAVAFYAFVKKERLVGAMIDGDRDVDAALPPPPAEDGPRVRATALAVFVCCALVAWLVVTQLR